MEIYGACLSYSVFPLASCSAYRKKNASLVRSEELPSGLQSWMIPRTLRLLLDWTATVVLFISKKMLDVQHVKACCCSNP